MPEDGGIASTTYDKFVKSLLSVVDGPVTFFRENITEPLQSKGQSFYYHRRLRRVPGIEECDPEDWVCHHEANLQFKRDKEVDTQIMNILKSRRIECELYYGPDAYPSNCGLAKDNHETSATNWFIKYGDLGASGTVRHALMKQKHRMLWERRHGPVGSGMKGSSLS